MKTSNEPILLDTEAQKTKKKSYFSEIKEELRKVTWTSKEELFFCTKIAVGSIFLFGMSIYVVDLLIKKFLDVVSLVIHFIFG